MTFKRNTNTHRIEKYEQYNYINDSVLLAFRGKLNIVNHIIYNQVL